MHTEYREYTNHELVGKRVKFTDNEELVEGLRGRTGTVSHMKDRVIIYSEEPEIVDDVEETFLVVLLDEPLKHSESWTSKYIQVSNPEYYEVLPDA